MGVMNKEEKKRLRMELVSLLEKPKENGNRIREIGKLLGGNGKENEKPKGKKSRKKYVDPNQYIEWRKQGINRKNIAALLGITENRLISEVSMLRAKGEIQKGVLKNGNNYKFTMTKEEFLESGLTRKEIIQKYGISNCAFSIRMKKWGLTRTPKEKILTYEKYCELKRIMLLDREIEIMYGFGKGTLYRLKRGWANNPIIKNV